MRTTTLLSPMPVEITFPSPHFQERYDRLKMKQFGQYHIMDWQVLEQLGLDAEIWKIFSTGGWLIYSALLKTLIVCHTRGFEYYRDGSIFGQFRQRELHPISVIWS